MKKYLIMIIRLLISVYGGLRKLILSNRTISSLLADLGNIEEFSDLYEHEKMISDSVRVASYHKAIRRFIGKDDSVVDLGTGTGILALLAARQGARKVYAIDHSSFIEVAKKISQYNGIRNIEFVNKHSREFSLKDKVDIIIHEQIGDYLYNENMIENLLDLKSRILKEDGIIFPGKFELFLEPVCIHDDYRVDFLWDNVAEGVDFRFLQNDNYMDKYKAPDYRQKWLDYAAYNFFLCDQEPIYFFDINRLNSPADINKNINISRKVVRAGFFDGFCLFFKVIFDEEIHFDTSPKSPRTHWGNCFFRETRRECLEGERINYRLTIGDILKIATWQVSVKK